jgi:hypothetical protein
VFRNIVLRRIFGLESTSHEAPHYEAFSNVMSAGGNDVVGENSKISRFVICTHHRTLFERSNK